MPPSAEPLFQDDASGEAWLQKGAALLEGRKHEREIEEKLRKAMTRSVLLEWQTWLAVFLGILALFQAHLSSGPLIVGLTAFCSVVSLLGALDTSNARRTLAMLAWMEHQREKERAAGKQRLGGD